MEGTARKGGKKNRKLGRLFRRPSHTRYINESRYNKNKVIRLARHLKNQPNDKVAIKALEKWKYTV